ncbi:MAG: hypothetical protein R2839_05560 [Thermomicrobiales bacterium]
MRRRSRLGPLQRSRLATATLLPVALIAATGSWMRTADGDWHRPGLGVLVSVLAYLMGVAAAVAKARAAAILMVFSPRSVRSVAVLTLIVGLVALLLGCVVASGSAGEQRSVVQIVGGECNRVGREPRTGRATDSVLDFWAGLPGRTHRRPNARGLVIFRRLYQSGGSS